MTRTKQTARPSPNKRPRVERIEESLERLALEGDEEAVKLLLPRADADTRADVMCTLVRGRSFAMAQLFVESFDLFDEMTLKELAAVYEPEDEDHVPCTFADAVAARIGVSPLSSFKSYMFALRCLEASALSRTRDLQVTLLELMLKAKRDE